MPQMMQVQKIAEETTISDSDSVKGALKKLRKVPEHELHFYLVLRDTLNATTPATRQAITLAQVESNRRTDSRRSRLAITTTIVSGVVGLVGVVLGAYLATNTSASPRDAKDDPIERSSEMAIEGTFRDGFIEGYKSVKGNNVVVPVVPVAPVTPVGQTPFRMGLWAGIKAAGG